MRLALLAILPAVGVLAQEPPPLPPADGPKIPVSGRVLTAGDQPVGGARVVITAMGRSELGSAVSDAAGRWTIPAAPTGQHFIRVIKAGYNSDQPAIQIPDSGRLSGVDLRLSRHAVIAGRVTDHLDRPVVGAEVTPVLRRHEDEGISFEQLGVSGPQDIKTDERGLFRAWTLPPGQYLLAVSRPAAPGAAGLSRLRSAPMLYPGVVSIEEATLLELDWGSLREDVQLRLPPPADTLAVARVLTDGGACAQCTLTIALTDGATNIVVAQTGRSTDGIHQIQGLPPGEYLFVANGGNFPAEGALQGIQRVRIQEGNPEAVRIDAVRPAPLRVRVTLDQPLEDVSSGRPSEWWLALRLNAPFGERLLAPSMRGPAQAQTEEREAVTELLTLPGRRRLEIMIPSDGPYVTDLRLNDEPLDSVWLDPPPEGFAGELTIRLGSEYGEVQGQTGLKRPAPASGLLPAPAWVMLEPRDRALGIRRPSFTRIEPDGSFVGKVPPGEYNAAAFASRADAATFMLMRTTDPELRKRMTPVTVLAGETTRVTLKPPP